MIRKITSKVNDKIKYLVSLRDSKTRKENNEYLAEGFKMLEMALSNRVVKEIYSLKEIPNIPSEIVQYIVDEQVMNKISANKTPEGVVFVCKIVEGQSYKNDKLIYLDHVADPGNAGTIIRTALSFGYDAVIFSNNSVDIYNEKVIAASKGAIFAIPVVKSDINEIKTNHQIIVSTLSDKSVSLEDAKATKPFILVLGNESHGASEEITKMSDLCVKIPMQNMDSLNVSIAAGILMYHFR